METNRFYNEILTEHNLHPEFKHDLPDAVEAVMQGEPEAPVAVAVTAIPSCKAVWPVLPIAASITAHTETPPAQAAAALAAWRSVPL